MGLSDLEGGEPAFELDRPTTARGGPSPGSFDPRRILTRLLSADRIGYAAAQSVLLQLATMAANLCTSVITARLLGAMGRGLYAAAITWPTLLGIVATAGVGSAVLVYIRRQPDQTTGAVVWGLVVALVITSALAAIAFPAMPLLLGEHNRAAAPVARAALVFAFVTALGNLYRIAFAGRGRFLLSNLAGFLPSLLYALGVVVLVVAGALTVETAVVALVIGGAASLLLLLPFFLAEVGGGRAGLRACGPPLRRFALRAAPADLLSLCSGWGDRLLLILLLSPPQLGLYVVAYGFSRVVTVATPFPGILLSAMSDRPESHSAKVLHDMVLRFSIASLAVVLTGVYLLDHQLIRLFYGAEFLPAVSVFRVLVLQAAANRIATVTSQLYLAKDRPALNSWFGLIDVVSTAVLMLVLAPAYGAQGAAIALLAGTSLRLALLWRGLLTHLRLRFPRLWPTVADLRALRGMF
jgi:O-antigen/teichoic acid export membrane protein